MVFDNCYVAEDKNGGYLAIRTTEKEYENAVKYVSLEELGIFKKFLAKAGSKLNKYADVVLGGQATIFKISINNPKRKDKEKETVYKVTEGRKKDQFVIPMEDILDLDIV